MKIKPILNNIIIRPEAPDEVSKGGILIPGRAQERPAWGTALYVGPGRVNDAGVRVPVGVNVGDTVFYHRNFAVPITLGEEKLVCVKEEECQLAIED